VIVVNPQGGLCNRMRVIASALLLSQRAGVPLEVRWFRTPDLNVRFDSLFVPQRLPARVREGAALTRVRRATIRAGEELKRLVGWLVLGDPDTIAGQFDPEACQADARRRDVLIRTNSKLTDEAINYRWFEPVPDCERRISAQLPLVTDAIGVHVRRTDNREATRWSPIESFVRLMEEEIERDPAARFFLATDSPSVSQQLNSRFSGRVHEVVKTSLSRNDPVAIKEALVDLYCLANTRRLIGSYWSSFTDTAAEINGIECRIAKSDG